MQTETIEKNSLEGFKKYLLAKNISETTAYAYCLYASKIIDKDITQELLNSIAKNKHLPYYCAIKHLVNYLDLKIELPKKQIVQGQTMADLGGYLNHKKVSEILSKAKTERDYVMFMVAYRCGRRISEVLNLKVNDLNFEDGVILFNILKKRREFQRYKAVDTETLTILQEYIKLKELQSEDYLFTSPQSKKSITRQRAFQIFRKMCEDAGITRIGKSKPHPHHLRHSHAVNFIKKANSSAALRILQQQLEHTNINATSIYMQFSQEDQKDMLNQVFSDLN